MTEVRSCHLVLLLSLACSVWGDYRVEVFVYTYNNPTSYCRDCIGDDDDTPINPSSVGCCDTFFRETCQGSQLCDNRFKFCWRPLGTGPGDDSAECQGIELDTTTIIEDTDSLDFTNTDVLGLSNPLTFSMQGPWTARQFYVEVIDRDNGGNFGFEDDFVDSFSIPVQTQQINRTSYDGYYNWATIELSFQVVCTMGFIGINCDVDPVVCSSVSCSGNGQCVDEGTTITCDCNNGFAGSTCDTVIADCQTQNCNGNGDCRDGVGCECYPGYTGIFCEIDIDDCLVLAVNCSGNGVCQGGINSFDCMCNLGYTGMLCEIDIDDCQSQDCSGNGSCRDGVGTFLCVCNSGYTGTLCDTNIDECQGVNCSGNGICQIGINSFSCMCNSGYTGMLCEANIDDCQSQDCSSNGICQDGINSFLCVCNSGFTGTLCDTNIDDCLGLAIDCSGNGICQDGINSFSCMCTSGYTGTLCEANFDDCQSQDCSSNGICQDGIDSFLCMCNSGYTGMLCDTDIDDCGTIDCNGNGDCFDGTNSFTCVCDTGYTGVNCGTLVTDIGQGDDEKSNDTDHTDSTDMNLGNATDHTAENVTSGSMMGGNMTAENGTTSSHRNYTPVLVGGIIGELLGTLAIAALIVGSGVAISRKLRERERRLNAQFELDLKSSEEHIEIPTNTPGTSVSSV